MKWTYRKRKAGVGKGERWVLGKITSDGATRSLSRMVLGEVDGVRHHSNLLSRRWV